jgi:hypothetical protein
MGGGGIWAGADIGAPHWAHTILPATLDVPHWAHACDPNPIAPPSRRAYTGVTVRRKAGAG